MKPKAELKWTRGNKNVLLFNHLSFQKLSTNLLAPPQCALKNNILKFGNPKYYHPPLMPAIVIPAPQSITFARFVMIGIQDQRALNAVYVQIRITSIVWMSQQSMPGNIACIRFNVKAMVLSDFDLANR